MKPNRLALVALGCGLFAVGQAYADRPVDELYLRSCVVCHASGVGNAPRTGDVDTWQASKDEKGDSELLEIVKSGLNAMPPLGLCMDCTDSEFQALIDFMATAQ